MMAGFDNFPNDPNFIPHNSLSSYDLNTSSKEQTENSQKYRPVYKPTYDDKSKLQDSSFVSTAVGIANLITENILSHPFIVLRRQCQVHYNSQKYHMTPITLIPALYHLHQSQGLSVLWKGIGSSLLLRGMTIGVEDLLSKTTPWPKEITLRTAPKKIFEHMLLKSVSLTIIMPFYSASLVETVQSTIASDTPGIFDVCYEGLKRILNWRNVQGRMLPIYIIFVPTLTLGICRHLISLLVKGITSWILHYRHGRRVGDRQGKHDNSHVEQSSRDIEMKSSFVALLVTDVVLFPFETILHRLYLQGTRTIIDNLDDGRSVLPILTNYSGPIDCYEICLGKEGSMGLYKGFGALILQYVAHILIIRLTQYTLTEVSTMIYKPKKKDP